MNTTPNIDLIALVESDLGQGKKSGRWVIHHCPFPAGHKHGDKNPSLRVTNGDSKRPPWWKCFGCGKGGREVKWVMEYRGLSYQDALHALKINKPETARPHLQEPPIQQPDRPPSEAWQARARLLITRAEAVLWSDRGAGARAWLNARGLTDETIRLARLGYLPEYKEDKSEAWGTPDNDPREINLLKGLLIPGFAGLKVWYLKMRPDKQIPGMKYLNVRGGRHALYNADVLTKGKPAVICEGELDALLLAQEIKDLARVVTLGSATNDLNLATWGLYLLRPSSFILAYHMDDEGNKGAEKLAWLHDVQRLTIPALQDGDKDLTDFHKRGGNLRSLIQNALDPAAPIVINWREGISLATPRGQYRTRPDQTVDFFYYPDQLALAIDISLPL